MAIISSNSDNAIKHLSSEYSKGKRYILAIGIDQYRYCNTLFNAVKDAKEVVDVLTSKYQFDKTAVTTLYDAEATRRNIYKCLDSFVQKMTANDTLLIYYSGHGQYIVSHDEGFWIPVEGQSDDTSSFISNSDIVTRIRAIKAFHIVVISDSCFSGSLFGVQRRDLSLGLQKQEAIESRWLFTSGRNTPVSDGRPGKNSPFADNLLYHLKENKQPILPLTVLSRFTTDAVANNSEQIPRCEPMKDVKHRGGEFMFRLKGVLPDVVEVENLSEDTFRTPSVLDDLQPTPKPFWLKWGKTPLLGVSLIIILIISIWVVKILRDRDIIALENTKLSQIETDSMANKITGNKDTQSAAVSPPINEPKQLKTTPNGQNTEGVGKGKTATPPATQPPKPKGTVVTSAKPTIEVDIEEQPEMCFVNCETNGISGVEVSIKIGGKSYKAKRNSSNELELEIPCNLKKSKKYANVTFSKGKISESREMQWENIHIPTELFND